jgi:hypothetical protein
MGILLCQPQLHPLPLADLLDLCPAVAAAESGRGGEMRLGGREKKMGRAVLGRAMCVLTLMFISFLRHR